MISTQVAKTTMKLACAHVVNKKEKKMSEVEKALHMLQKIRYELDDFENMDDTSEMIDAAQRLSADIDSVESVLMGESDE